MTQLYLVAHYAKLDFSKTVVQSIEIKNVGLYNIIKPSCVNEISTLTYKLFEYTSERKLISDIVVIFNELILLETTETLSDTAIKDITTLYNNGIEKYPECLI